MVSPGEQGGSVSQGKRKPRDREGDQPRCTGAQVGAGLAWRMSLAPEDCVHLVYK